MRYVRFALLGLLALAVALFAASGTTPVYAATFNADSTADAVDANPGDGVCSDASGDCTLRAAIQETNALAGPDIISLAAGTYTLTIAGTGENAAATGDLDVTDDLAITGASSTTTIIDGGGLDRVFHVHPGNTVEIAGVTIRNGAVAIWGRGGGIFNSGTLTVASSTVSANSAHYGGGITNDGYLSMASSTVSHNTASTTGGGYGGGIYNGGTATLTNLAVSGNTAVNGGGILNSGAPATMTITNSTVSDNTSSLDGGGILNTWGGTVALTGSTVSGNKGLAGGGMENASGGTVALSRVTVTGNSGRSSGGGIANFNGAMTLSNSTVSGNTSSATGGGIYNQDDLTITSSTITGNTASSLGGGVDNAGGTVTLKNTIVANSPAGGDCSGTITSAGHNLDSDGTCGLAAGGDISNTDPLLGPLADNGGPTETHALLAGSPAIDAGDNSACPVTDQRGVARPEGAACDIGAYEFAPNADSDNDGFSNADELAIGTDPLAACGVDCWPPDTYEDQLVDSQDMVALLPGLFKSVGQEGYSARLDIFQPGTIIDSQDLVAMVPFLFKSCTTP